MVIPAKSVHVQSLVLFCIFAWLLCAGCLHGWWRWELVSPDGVAPSWMVSVYASVNLPLHHKVQKFSSGTGSPGWSRKKGRKTVVVWCRITNYLQCCDALSWATRMAFCP